MSGTRQVRLYQSLVRPHLLMGAERQAVMIAAAVATVIYFFTLSVPGLIVAVTLFALALAVLRRLAAADPQMIAVVRRGRKHQAFYGDGATLDAPWRDIPQPQAIPPTTKLLSVLAGKGNKHAEHQGVSQ